MNPDSLTRFPDQGQVQIWTARFSDWKSKIPELRDLLSAREVVRVERLKVRVKQEQGITSRALTRIILSSYLDQPPPDIPIQTSKTGKPYLASSDLSFNISHSEDIFVCGVTSVRQIGIDIQKNYPIDNMDKIIRNYFSEDEGEYLRSRPSDQLTGDFFSIWTAKEAFLKATGSGFQESPTRISTLPDRTKDGYFLPETGSNQLEWSWNISTIKVDPDYTGAIAVNGEILGINMTHLDPGDIFPS